MRILLVEDDEALCAAVAPLLEQEGYRVDVCRDGDDALYYMRQRMFVLCILDRMLPGRDGLSVLRAARAEGLDTPVLMTTALGLVGDRVDGLDAGADDYLVKPFDVRELLARVRALARRPAPVAVSGRPCCGDRSGVSLRNSPASPSYFPSILCRCQQNKNGYMYIDRASRQAGARCSPIRRPAVPSGSPGYSPPRPAG